MVGRGMKCQAALEFLRDKSTGYCQSSLWAKPPLPFAPSAGPPLPAILGLQHLHPRGPITEGGFVSSKKENEYQIQTQSEKSLKKRQKRIPPPPTCSYTLCLMSPCPHVPMSVCPYVRPPPPPEKRLKNNQPHRRAIKGQASCPFACLPVCARLHLVCHMDPAGRWCMSTGYGQDQCKTVCSRSGPPLTDCPKAL